MLGSVLGRYENLFFLEGHKNYRVGTKKTGLVRIGETQVFFKPNW